MTHLADIISTLEQLVTDVETNSRERPNDVEQTLEKAIATTSKLIRDAIPQKELQSEWLSQLSTIGHPDQGQISQVDTMPKVPPMATEPIREDSESKQCACPLELSQVGNSATDHPSPSLVQCIHGCNTFFCSAICRKRRMRAHRPKCHALMRKEVLRKIGLNSSEELF